MTEFAVKVPFIGRDNVSNVIQNMNRNMSTFGKTTNSVFKNIRKESLSVKSIFGGMLGAIAVQRGIGLASQGIRSLGEDIVDFDHIMTSAAAKFGKEGFGKSAKEFTMISQSARSAAKFTGDTMTSSAGAMLDFAQAGLSVSDSMSLIKPAAILAKAGDVELAQGAKYASTSLAVFNKEAKDFTTIGDILTWTANASKMSFADLYETMKMGGKAINVATRDIQKDNKIIDVATFSAIARAMGDAGIVGEQAGTHMKTGFIRMISGGKMADAELKKLKLTRERGGRLVDLLDMIQQLEDKYSKMSSASQVASMRKLFGLEALPGMLTVMSAGSAKLKQFRKEALDATGYTGRVFEKMSQSYETKINRIKTLLVDVGFRVADQYGDKIPVALEKVYQYVSGINVGNIVSGLNAVKDTVSTLYSIIKSSMPLLKSMATIWAGFKIKSGISTLIGTGLDISNMSKMIYNNKNPFLSSDLIVGSGAIRPNGLNGRLGSLTINRNTLDKTGNEAANLTRKIGNVANGLNTASGGFDKTYNALNKLNTIFTAGTLATGVYVLVDALSESSKKMADLQLKYADTLYRDIFSSVKSEQTATGAGKNRSKAYDALSNYDDFASNFTNTVLSGDFLGSAASGQLSRSNWAKSIGNMLALGGMYNANDALFNILSKKEIEDLQKRQKVQNKSNNSWNGLPYTWGQTIDEGQLSLLKSYKEDDYYNPNIRRSKKSYKNGRIEYVPLSSEENNQSVYSREKYQAFDYIRMLKEEGFISNNKQKVEVEINFSGNVPDGTTAKTKENKKAPIVDRSKMGAN